LLVGHELARAIRTESAVAITHWWGVGTKAIWQWRKAFGISQFGTHRQQTASSRILRARCRKTRDVPLPANRVELRRQNAIRLNLGHFIFASWLHDWATVDARTVGVVLDGQ